MSKTMLARKDRPLMLAFLSSYLTITILFDRFPDSQAGIFEAMRAQSGTSDSPVVICR